MAVELLSAVITTLQQTIQCHLNTVASSVLFAFTI